MKSRIVLAFVMVLFVSCGREIGKMGSAGARSRSLISASELTTIYSDDFQTDSYLSNFELLSDDAAAPTGWSRNSNLLEGKGAGGTARLQAALLKHPTPNGKFVIDSKLKLPGALAKIVMNSALTFGYQTKWKHFAFYVYASPKVKVGTTMKNPINCVLIEKLSPRAEKTYRVIRSKVCGYFEQYLVPVQLVVNGTQFTAEMVGYPTMKMDASLPTSGSEGRLGMFGAIPRFSGMGQHDDFSLSTLKTK